MKISRRILVIFLLVLVPLQSKATVRRSWPTMGTLAEVTLDAEPSDRADQAIETVREVFSRVNRTMTVYDKNSDLNEINRWAGFRPVRVDSWLVEVVGYGKEAQIVTGGAFRLDVLAKGMKRGLKPKIINAVPRDYGPVGIEVNQFQNEVMLQSSGMAIDLGGIAKGYALDQAGERLEARGFKRYVINLGRSLKLGDPPADSSGWPVTVAGEPSTERASNVVISTSRQDVRSDTAHVVLRDSGDEDPATRQVTVAATEGWVSDMASTALLVNPSLRHRLIRAYPSIRWIEVRTVTSNEPGFTG